MLFRPLSMVKWKLWKSTSLREFSTHQQSEEIKCVPIPLLSRALSNSFEASPGNTRWGRSGKVGKSDQCTLHFERLLLVVSMKTNTDIKLSPIEGLEPKLWDRKYHDSNGIN
jgi:hypothetical protein